MLLRLEYSPGIGMAYLGFVPKAWGIVKRTYPFDPRGIAAGLHLDFNEAKQLVGIEFDGAKYLLSKQILDQVPAGFVDETGADLVEFDISVHITLAREYGDLRSDVVSIHLGYDSSTQVPYSCGGSGIAKGIVAQFTELRHLAAILVVDASRRLPPALIERATAITYDQRE